LSYRAVKTACRYDVPFWGYLGASTASRSARHARYVRADSEHAAVYWRVGKSRYWSNERSSKICYWSSRGFQLFDKQTILYVSLNQDSSFRLGSSSVINLRYHCTATHGGPPHNLYKKSKVYSKSTTSRCTGIGA